MILDKEAREKLKKGVAKLRSAVEVTLGPCGHNVIIHDNMGVPYATKDGISVAKKVFSTDVYENAGISIVREASLKTAELAGDGTTTTCILADYMIKNGAKDITPEYIQDMREAVEDIIGELKVRRIPIGKEYKMLAKVATISAKSEEIGNLVASAFEKAGENGTVLFEESATSQTYIEESLGTIVDRGYVDKTFVNDTKSMTAVYNNPTFLLVDDRIDKFSKIEKTLASFAQQGKDVIIFAHDYSSEVIRLLSINDKRGIIKVVPIQTECTGTNRLEFIKDIAALVGATKSSTQEGLYSGGTCDKITVYGTKTIIVKEGEYSEEFKERIEFAKGLIEYTDDEPTQEYFRKKLARLVGKLYTIKVGGFTPAELRERYDRVEDAVCAAKSALAEGVVPGGGILFYRLVEKLSWKNTSSGYQLVLDAIQQPIKVLAKNSNYKIKNWNNLEGYQSIDFSSRSERPVDAIEAGILDPVKVLRVSLEHAVAVAILILNTKCIVETNENTF